MNTKPRQPGAMPEPRHTPPRDRTPREPAPDQIEVGTDAEGNPVFAKDPRLIDGPRPGRSGPIPGRRAGRF